MAVIDVAVRQYRIGADATTRYSAHSSGTKSGSL
jgi:hypothetical protein